MNAQTQDTWPVPERVRAGSPNPITHFDDYLRACHAADVDPDGFWLQVTHGLVRWRTDHDEAFREAKASGRPLLLLFQEIPG